MYTESDCVILTAFSEVTQNRENYIIRSFIICTLLLFTKNNTGDRTEVDEVGRTHSMHVEMNKAYKLLIKKPELKNQPENTHIHGRIALKWILEKQGVCLWT
jgi:hypothetical protein